MSVVIDPLSVATQGYIETPSTTNVESNRDALRIGTLGWVIIDFSLVPAKTGDPTFAFFTNPFSIAQIQSGETKSFVLEYSSDAAVGPKITAVIVETSYLKFDALSTNTEANVQASTVSAKLEVESLAAQDIHSPGSAVVEADRASAIIEPKWQECRKV